MIFCDTEISDYTIRNCGIDHAGIVAIGIINIYETPTTTQLEDPDFWSDKTSETPLKYWAIKNTRGEYLGGEQTEEEDLIGYLITGSNHQAIIEVENLKENYVFWDRIQKHNWKICLVNSGGLMFYVDKPVSFYPKINNPKSNKSAAFFNVQMKWQDLSNPYILNEPDGVFV